MTSKGGGVNLLRRAHTHFNPHNNLLLTVQAWCKEHDTSDKLISIADAPKAGRFLEAWCSGKWVSSK